VSERKQKLRQEITGARAEALEAVSELSQEQLNASSTNDGWRVKDVLAHLSSIEARLRAMWQHALDGRPWPADDSSVDAYNERCVAERRDWTSQALIQELCQSGDETLSFLDRIAESDLDHIFDHPVRGPVTVETLMWIIPRHLREHAEQFKPSTQPRQP
jgi:uncharacterized damage-inducible protein DinB